MRKQRHAPQPTPLNQQHELPEKNPKFTPRFTASMQWSYCLRLQYSSCPTDRNALRRVIVSSEIRPGVYGRVEFGSAPPPPLVYAKPVVIVQERPSPQMQPIYLHVPPGHAKKWSKHCHKYNACGQPVYFVKSEEYEPKKPKKEK